MPGIEDDAPDIGAGEAVIALLPGLAAIFGDGDARAPASDSDAFGICGIERDAVKVPIDADTAGVFEGLAAIVRGEEACALGGGEPVAGIVGRLFDAEDGPAGGSGEGPGLAAVFAAEEAFFAADDESFGLGAIDADGFDVVAVEVGGELGPGCSAVVSDAEALAVGEVDSLGIGLVDG